ncbi:MAG: glycosyltransferase [Ignavibacteria bacterium]|nr:glycosyltransferase [Ignavibacteria bacterium]
MLGDFTTNIILPVPKGVERPLWSVMMPTYNPKDYIFEALESVLKQYPDDGSMQLEIIDDCSTKVDIPKIIEKIDDKRIGYYRNPKNVGHSFNFTEAVRKSRGHLVHILHDDDLVKPGFYEAFAKIFEEYKEIGAAYCRQEYIDDDGKTMFFSEPDLEKTGILDNALIKLAEKQRVQYCAMVVRRSAYEKVGGYVMKNIGCEDWEMWVRIASQFDIAYEPEALAKYRIHTTSMTLNDMRTGQDMRFLREAADIFTKYLPEEKREEVSKKRNVHYGNYSFENAKKLFKQYDDEQGAAAQLTETIILDSNKVFSNLDLISEFKVPITGMGVSVVIPVSNYDARIANTIRQLANLRKFDYIPSEIILVDGSGNKETKKTALEAVERFRLRTPFRVVDSGSSKYFRLIDNGIKNAKYSFVVINNPGVFLDLNYIKIASESMLMANDIGAIGGRVEAIADIDLPEWISEFRKDYGVGEVIPLSGLIVDPKSSLLGSGIILRKEAWDSLKTRHFRFSEDSDDTSAEILFRELSAALRLSGWRLYVNNDLKSKKHFEEVHLGWRNLRLLHRKRGEGFLTEKYYEKLQQKTGPNKLKDFTNTSPRKRNIRKKIRRAYHHLRKQHYWNEKYFDSSLTGSRQILISEKYLGIISDLLNDIPAYTKRLRLIKRIAYKWDLKLLRVCFVTTPYDYPNYPRKNSTKGVTLIMLNRSGYMPNLYRAIRDLTYQDLPKGFKWEVMIFGKPIDAEAQHRIQQILNTSPIKIPIDYYREEELNFKNILKNYIDSSNYENLILIGENDRLSTDYVRTAYRFMNSQHEVAAVGGYVEFETSVAAPKWFNIYKSMYCQQNPAEVSGDITSTEKLLVSQGIVVRKSAVIEAMKTAGEETNDAAFSNSLLHAFRNNGWEISYQSRLKLRHIIYEKDLRWEVMRKNFWMLGTTENILTKENIGSEIVSSVTEEKGLRIGEIVSTVNKLNKYPFGKIFSEKNEFRGDSDILEIEKLKGKLSKLTGFGNGHNGKNGNGIKLPLMQQQKKLKKPEIIPGVSVVICCYNSEKVLPMTLNHLCTQNVPNKIPWEIIIVDNASTDNTAEVAKKIFEGSDCLCDFKIVKEINPGLSAARLKGLESAKYEYVIFCDDDNHLDKNFVRHTFDIMHGNDEIGVLGGQSTTEFDILPKNWFYDWQDSFAIGKQSENNGDITWTRGYVWGASMVVRRSAFRKLIQKGFKSNLTDRKGTALSAGGDTEICYALRNDGWKIWYDSRLMFRHHIPPERLDWKYLRKLFRGFGQASAVLDVYLKKSSVKFKKQFKGKRPRSKTFELRKTLHELRKIRYKNYSHTTGKEKVIQTCR